MIKFLVSIVTIIVSAFATVALWGWFVVPLGVVAIGALQAMGLLLLLRATTIKQIDITTAIKTREDDVTQAGYVALVIWLFVWLTGYIIHLCM